jgi:hypothetical protein
VTIADGIRLFLLLGVFAMAALAMFYLRRRNLDFISYLAWGLLAVLLPILGPFLVITLRPGSSRRAIPAKQRLRTGPG